MASSDKDGNGVREFRLEGIGLLLVGGLLIILLGGAFWGGRWYERQVGPGVSGSAANAISTDPLANVAEAEPAADVDKSADFFDEAQGGQKELEPQREARSEPARAVPPPATVSDPPAQAAEAPSGGSFFVQVFAGRDRNAAEGLVRKLSGNGYPVRLFSEREGRGALYKVRVGGYPSRDAAGRASDKLKEEGYTGAWITEVD